MEIKLDGLTFFKIMTILNRVLQGAVLNKITILEDSVYFSFYTNGILNIEFRSAPTPAALFKTLKISGESQGALSAVSGAMVSAVKSFGYERAGYIELKKRRPSGKLLVYKAVIEPAGNYANFLLLDESDTILYSLSSRTIDPDRNIGAGGKYTKPRLNKKYSLDNYEGAKSFSELAGFYPVTAAIADEAANVHGFDNTVALIKEGISTDDNFYINPKGKVIPFFIPDAVKTVDWTNISEFYPKKKSGISSRATDNLKKIFSSKMDKYIRLAEKLEKELQQAKNSDLWADEATLIKSNIHRIKGPGNYIFDRYTESGVEKVSYQIEYGEDISLKADKLFKKATRLKKSIPLIEERLQDAIQMAISAEEQLFYIENNLDSDEAAEFERLISLERKGMAKKDKRTIHKPFYEAVFNGGRIYAGRSSVSNYELVFRYAIDSDIWFHAKNIPSAHVLLRLDGGQPLTEDLINKCAGIAAGLSKRKTDSWVEVDYTLRRYVNKPKNTPIGFVTYKRFKTLSVKPMSNDNIKTFFNITL